MIEVQGMYLMSKASRTMILPYLTIALTITKLFPQTAPIVETRFVAQVQSVWDLGLVSSVQYICRKWIKELGFSELDNGQYG